MAFSDWMSFLDPEFYARQQAGYREPGYAGPTNAFGGLLGGVESMAPEARATQADQLRGLLDLSSQDKAGAARMGMLQFGAGLLSQLGDRDTHPLAAIARSGLGAMQGYGQALGSGREQRLQEALLPMQLEKYRKKTPAEMEEEQYATAKGRARAESEFAKPGKPFQVTAGDRTLFLDPETLEETKRIPHGVSPSAKFSATEASERARQRVADQWKLFQAGEAGKKTRAAEAEAGRTARAGMARQRGTKEPKPVGWDLTRDQALKKVEDLMGGNELFSGMEDQQFFKVQDSIVDSIPRIAKSKGISLNDAASEAFRLESQRVTGGAYDPARATSAEIAAGKAPSAAAGITTLASPEVMQTIRNMDAAVMDKTLTEAQAIDNIYKKVLTSMPNTPVRAQLLEELRARFGM